MKLLLISTIFALLCTSNATEIKKGYYENGQLKYQVNSINGLLQGSYTAWHENGQKKATGYFENNQRVGDWNIWNSEGILRLSRTYSNHFQFSHRGAKNDEGAPITWANQTSYDITRNKKNYIDFPKTAPNDVYVERKIWRTIPKSESNAHLVNQTVFARLLATVASSDLAEELKHKNFSLEDYELLEFKVKEVWFFDVSKKIAESRILALCPSVLNKKTQKKEELFWVDFEDLRTTLAAIAVDPNTHSTAESLLHFRQFESQIYKESNVYNRLIADYKKGDAIKAEAESIEMDLIDREHDLWLLQQ